MTRLHLIDWNIETVLGWEIAKSDKVIASIVSGIQAGDIFPPVPVNQFGYKFYIDPSSELISSKSGNKYWAIDGGHHRAVAHFITRHPLLVRVLRYGTPPGNFSDIGCESEDFGSGYFPISETMIIDDAYLPFGDTLAGRSGCFANYRQLQKISSQL